MYSLKRLFLPSRAPDNVPAHAWSALRLAQLTTLVFLGMLGLLFITALAALFMPQWIANMAIITELALSFLGSIISVTLSLWSLHRGVWDSFKEGRILIVGLLFLGFSTAGVLALIGIIFLVTR